MTKPLNVGLIGYGFMGRAHSNAYSQVNHFFDLPLRPVLKAVCGRSAEGTQAFAEKWGYESVETDWQKLVGRKVILSESAARKRMMKTVLKPENNPLKPLMISINTTATSKLIPFPVDSAVANSMNMATNFSDPTASTGWAMPGLNPAIGKRTKDSADVTR